MAQLLVPLGGCQTACNAAWVACYAAAGLVAGTVTGGIGAPVAALNCNAQQGVCTTFCFSGATVATVTATSAGLAGLGVAASVGAAGMALGAGMMWARQLLKCSTCSEFIYSGCHCDQDSEAGGEEATKAESRTRDWSCSFSTVSTVLTETFFEEVLEIEEEEIVDEALVSKKEN